MKYDVLTVATNKYKFYWKELVLSAEKILEENSAVTFHVFTDDPADLESFGLKLQKIRIIAHKIEALTWPEATLHRYKIISSFSNSFKGDVLLHLDADMLLMGDFTQLVAPQDWKRGVALVSHPGYWRPQGIERVNFYRKNPRYLLKDFLSELNFGGRGIWEIDSQSSAFVARRKRNNYVCGGTWMGWRTPFLELVAELELNVERDAIHGVMAIWHDESHLNQWAANNEHSILDPRFCYDPSYKQLASIPEVIRAVDKGKN
jgi:hypothetical protein